MRENELAMMMTGMADIEQAGFKLDVLPEMMKLLENEYLGELEISRERMQRFIWLFKLCAENMERYTEELHLAAQKTYEACFRCAEMVD